MNGDDTIRPLHVLMVEDSPSDADLAMQALHDAKVHVEIDVVEDGEQAMAYLHQKGQYADAGRPDLILLDLNLPKKDGREVLAEVRANADLTAIPVVILTTSEDEEDVLKAYQLHASAYVTKPVDFEQFIKVVKTIDDFWFTVVKLPPNPHRRPHGHRAANSAT